MRQSVVLSAAAVLLSAALLGRAAIPDGEVINAARPTSPPAGSVTNTATADKQNDPPAKATTSSITAAFGVEEIEKMVAAGVSTEVITNYIQKGLVTRRLTPAELISLKEHKVPDEITAALLRRADEVKAEAWRERNGSMVKYARDGQPYLDLDSYEFWWYHYGYPRVLATSRQILYPYPNEPYLYPYPYFGYGAPVAYGAYLSAGYPRFGFHGSGRGFYGRRPWFPGGRPFYGASRISGPSIQTVSPLATGRVR